jgi:aminodeoxychorismate synthase component I
MSSQPRLSLSRNEFVREASEGDIPPLYLEIPFIEPYKVYEILRGPGSMLLESVKGPMNIARYSFICIEPFSEYRIRDGKETLRHKGENTVELSGKPLKTLRALISRYSQRPAPGLPPFQGGAAGLLCYDFVRYLERVPQSTQNDLGVPDAHIYFYDRLVAFDHKEHKAWAVSAPGARAEEADDLEAAYDKASEAIMRFKRDISLINDTHHHVYPEKLHTTQGEIKHDVTGQQYIEMVRRVKEYIAEGDIFQANLSLRLSADIGDTDPWQLYLTLREINPSPFAGYLDFGEYVIASSSPERLVRVNQGMIDTRPIAGTRPRGQSAGEDDRMREDLLLSEKERAEHIMLIDLERNDLGRVCDYGSINVDELMITEDYSHVMHIVSNVRGRLAKGKDMLDAIRAAFPGGTITGVPKVRCMEIIDELEDLRRGPYTGSFGYLGYSGNMDLNIVIRTFTVKDGRATVQAGAGIVADSDPEHEYRESLKKAEALIRTLEISVRA